MGPDFHIPATTLKWREGGWAIGGFESRMNHNLAETACFECASSEAWFIEGRYRLFYGVWRNKTQGQESDERNL